MLTISIFLLVFCIRSATVFRTSTCLRDHEEFSLCGWRCPPTCVNIRLSASDMCPSTWDCRVGCRCSAGFVRDELSKKCVLVQNCPGVFAVVALSVSGAPTYSEGEQPRYVNQQQIEEFLRERRAPYGPQFVTPCASAGPMQLPVSSVPVAAFSAPSYQGYAVPQYGYAMPHYRSVEEQQEQELLGFSDMDQFEQGHVPMARVGRYGAASVAGVSPALSGVGGRVLTQATSGTALGVFPNANIGGCGVPLLFSCSPTIVTGHMIESQAHVAPTYAAAADSYRLVDEPAQHEVHDSHQHEELLTHEHMNHEPSHANINN